MTKTLNNRFEKIPLTTEEKIYLKSYSSFRKIFLADTILFVPFLFGLILCCFFPWFPHPVYGFGAQNPSSIQNYFEIVGKNILVVLCFIVFLIFLITIINFLRAQLDIIFDFKKVGIFKVTTIKEKNDIKFIRLSNGKKLKRKSSEIPFNKLNEQDTVEICESATNRPISFRIIR
ncbi:MAG TPA: hypothetical protein VLI68_12745 [Hanamia sp.]|nr:hypothetical protein [Hanamia sp.]